MFETNKKIFFGRTLKIQYGSNCIVLWSKFVGNIGKCNADRKTTIILRAIWVKFCCLWFSFWNAFETEDSMSLWWNVMKTLCGQYGSNHIVRIVSWLEFARNIAKFNIDRTICNLDKEWSKFTKWTIWISPYCPWLKFFKNISSSKKELSMESYVESLKGQYGSNCILSWSEFPICAFDKNWSMFSKWMI